MITVDTGERLRPAEPSDEQMIWETLRDWPSGPDTRALVAHNIRYSMDAFDPAVLRGDPVPHIPFALVVLEDSGFLGCCEWTHHAGGFSGIDIHRIAIHPSHRGQGHFRTFYGCMAYLATQVLGVAGGDYRYYAEYELPDGTRIEPADRALKRHILAGEMEARELSNPLTVMRDDLRGQVVDHGFRRADARLNSVHLDAGLVSDRIDPSRYTLSDDPV